jgi:hypothetical protein
LLSFLKSTPFNLLILWVGVDPEETIMLHLLYILAFTILSFLAIGNLIRHLLTLGVESQRSYNGWSQSPRSSSRSRLQTVPHPEFLDDAGNVIREPLLVMRSMTFEDAREHLDSLYNSSPGANSEPQEEA